MVRHGVRRRTVLAGAGTLIATAGCMGDSGSNYPEEPVEFEALSSPGGGTDSYIRTLADPLSSELSVDVQPTNRPPLEQTLPTIWEDDTGYVITLYNPTPNFNLTLENGKDSLYNAVNWNLLGCPNTTASTVLMSTESSNYVETWEELEEVSTNDGVDLKAALLGQGQMVTWGLLRSNTDLEVELVSGFGGTGEIISQLQQGAVDLFMGPASTIFPLVADEVVTPILSGEPDKLGQTLLDRYAEIGHDPFATSYSEIGLDNLETLTQSSRTIMAPPEVPDDRVEILRNSVWNSLNSDTFAEAAQESNLPTKLLNAEELRSSLEAQMETLFSIEGDLNLDS